MRTTWTLLAATALLTAGTASAQTAPAPAPVADPYAGDPTGIVADPCPAHPGATGAQEQMRIRTRDFAQLCRYAAANRAMTTRPEVVFMGDSITEGWIGADPAFFTGGRVDRGISGQTTPQMLLRFRQDVIALRPRAVHIMAGTNDIAGNTGAATIETVEGNIMSMAELARANGIRVILASVPPAAKLPWAPDKPAAAQIAALNVWAKGYAKANGFTWVDYHPALAMRERAMKPGFASDGVHPTPAGYAAMRPVALAAIARTLGPEGATK